MWQKWPPRPSCPCLQHSLLVPSGYSWCLPSALAACALYCCHGTPPHSLGCHHGIATCSGTRCLQWKGALTGSDESRVEQIYINRTAQGKQLSALLLNKQKLPGRNRIWTDACGTFPTIWCWVVLTKLVSIRGMCHVCCVQPVRYHRCTIFLPRRLPSGSHSIGSALAAHWL